MASQGVDDKPRVSERSEAPGGLPDPKIYSCQMGERGKILLPGTYEREITKNSDRTTLPL